MNVLGTTTAPMFNCKLGRVCHVRRTFFRNGEHWYALTCKENGERFESPSVFWEEQS